MSENHKQQPKTRLIFPSQSVRKERLWLILLLVGVIGAGMLYSNLWGKLQQLWFPKSELYGLWIEQNVAPYAAQKIAIDTQGIVINGRLVTTHFDYNGTQLAFVVNGQSYQFDVLLEQKQMKHRVSADYLSIYHLSEK